MNVRTLISYDPGLIFLCFIVTDCDVMAKTILLFYMYGMLVLAVVFLINLHSLMVTERMDLSLQRNEDSAACEKRRLQEMGYSDSEGAIGTDVELVDALISNISKTNNMSNTRTIFPDNFWNMTLGQLTHQLGFDARSRAKHLPVYANVKMTENTPAWMLVHKNIRQFSLYSPDDHNVNQLLHDLSTLPIIEAAKSKDGMQLQIDVRLNDGGWAILKAMRYSRDAESDNIFDGFEKHIAEIAAFQLDRILGFYRVPPTVGRLINITSELKPIVPKAIANTMFISSAGNVCFYGSCLKYCERMYAFCGYPDIIEVSMQSYLPSKTNANRIHWDQPWRDSTKHKRRAFFEENNNLCTRRRKEPPYNNGKLLLDIIDAHTFDFLSGNKDRQRFVVFKDFGHYSFPVLSDNGRGYERKMFDAESILAPLKQCCLIRESTFLKYIKLYQGPEKLSELMEKALENDPVAPVLIKEHLAALDRRVIKILRTVADCVQKFGFEEVIIHDRF